MAFEGTFYDSNNKKVFEVMGYCTNFLIIEQQVKDFCKRYKVKKKDVTIDFITQSRRYKSMFVIYADVQRKPYARAEVYPLGKNWSMWQWLQN
jgi:hypothetical protein